MKATLESKIPILPTHPAQKPPLEPLYRQVYRSLRQAILSGALPPQSKLPSSRELARTWGVARNTVLEALELLAAEGFLEMRPASGTYISATIKSEIQSKPQKVRPSPTPPLSEWAKRALEQKIEAKSSTPITIDFRMGNVPTSLFPAEEWAASLKVRSKDLRGLAGGYGQGLGPLETREALCEYLAKERGILATPDMVMLSSGSQGSLDMLARVFLEPGRSVVVEDPSYLGALQVFSASGAQVIPIPVDHEGLHIEHLVEKLVKGVPSSQIPALLYTTPSHHFPTGAVMSVQRRLELLEWAQNTGCWVIEDDYNSEFRFDGRPISALQALAPHLVIHLGTFSKSLAPALRAGYLVAPPELIETLSATRYLTDRQPPTLDSLALADFIRSGGFARHIKRARVQALERLSTLRAALTQHLPDWQIKSGGAGLHLYLELPPYLLEREVVARAYAAGIALEPLAKYAQRVPTNGVLLSFAHLEPAQIVQGIVGVAGALE